jgi:formylglycine-generating enzyme required for sulfatase activity
MSMAERDDFSAAVKRIVAARVGYRCSNPDCRKQTSGPQADLDKAVNIGVAAHITAAAPGGPRYDPDLSSEERGAIDNALWLCQSCAKLIDSDVGRYTVELLREWKEGAERAAQEELEQRIPRDMMTAQPVHHPPLHRPPRAAHLAVPEKKPRILLCHAKEDKPGAVKLYHQLKEAGYHPWLDKYDLLPGQDWWTEIEKIIGDPYNLVVVCLSPQSIDKRGVVQEEIATALDVLKKMPEDTIYLIPARLEPCQVPRRLSRLHWVDLFEADGFAKLRGALDFEIGQRQPPRQPFEPVLVLIPAGEFVMGSDPGRDKDAYEREKPRHTMYLPEYYIARTPVTNAQYAVFVQAVNHKLPLHWNAGKPPAGKEDHPVVKVSWYDAIAYCNWLTKATGRPYRLPSEAEWEKGGRGTDERIYPWGNQWDASKCNSLESGAGDTTPVTSHPHGVSPYDLLDMAGNVWEWTCSLWGFYSKEPDFKYAYDRQDGRENLKADSDTLRVLRGGAFNFPLAYTRCAFRGRGYPYLGDFNVGFRVCVAPRQD